MLEGSVAREVGSPTMPRNVPATAIDQIMAIGTVAMDRQARIVVSFQGRVDEDRLARAVDLTLRAEPMLGYRFTGDARRPYWERADEAGPAYQGMVEGSSDIGLNELLVQPVSPEQAPQVRVHLFRSEHDQLCIRSNHLAMDGGGALRYLFLLASIYRQLGKDPDYLPGGKLPARPGPRQVIGNAGLIASLGALLRTRPPGAMWGVPRSGDDLSQQAFLTRRIGPERLEAVRTYARSRSATVNDLLLAAYCRSLFTVLDPPAGKRLRVEVPTDLRKYLPGDGKVIGDLSAVYFLSIDRRLGEAFDETLSRVHADMGRNKRDRTELGQMLLLELLMLPGVPVVRKLKSFFQYEPFHPALSNLGAVDPALVSFGNVVVDDIQVIGPTTYPPNLALHVCTYRRTMSLGINCCSSAMDPGIADRILDLVLDELPNG